MASHSGRAKAGLRHQVSGDFRLLRRWRPPRRAGAGIAAGAAAAVVVSVTGMTAGAGAAWWNIVIVAAGSILAGLVVGSYIGAPVGAEARVCDARWPVLGLTGLVIATSTGQGTLATHLFTGATAAVLTGLIQPAFALLAMALLGWALREHLELERKAVSASDGGDESGVCTTCRPHFPIRPGTSRGPSI